MTSMSSGNVLRAGVRCKGWSGEGWMRIIKADNRSVNRVDRAVNTDVAPCTVHSLWSEASGLTDENCLQILPFISFKGFPLGFIEQISFVVRILKSTSTYSERLFLRSYLYVLLFRLRLRKKSRNIRLWKDLFYVIV